MRESVCICKRERVGKSGRERDRTLERDSDKDEMISVIVHFYNLLH